MHRPAAGSSTSEPGNADGATATAGAVEADAVAAAVAAVAAAAEAAVLSNRIFNDTTRVIPQPQ
jgi:hypothetical protein